MPKDLSGQQTGVNAGNGLNNPRTAHYRGRNAFPQSYAHATTERYGEFSPFFHAKCERGDVQNLQPLHDIHTYTFKSPNTISLSLHKTYMKCPMEAIYPRNWDKMLPIPVQGDDVPSNTRALFHVRELVETLCNIISNPANALSYIKSVLLLESISSYGSLFYKFNYHLCYLFEYNGEVMSFDKWFDTVFVPLIKNFAVDHYIYMNSREEAGSARLVRYYIRDDSNADRPNTPSEKYLSTRRYIEMLRYNEFSIFGSEWDEFISEDLAFVSGYSSTSNDELNPSSRFLNIEPIIAYQLCCAQFGTNDHIDFIFSAQLFRDNMQAIASEVFRTIGREVVPTYMRNGMAYQYDVFSQLYFDWLIYSVSQYQVGALDYFLNLFSYNPSLRYGDYFTGGRAQPLAVGEYNVPVTGEGVSIIETVRKIQLERLAHHANLVGPKMSDYLSGIYGGPLPQAPKDVPIFLTLQDFKVGGFETNNTGAQQFAEDEPNSITMNLRSTESRFAFEVEIAEPCWIIGIDYYDCQRLYSRTIDRFAFHHDRYDDFIPELQYIGDQDIKSVELDATRDDDLPFAYALRNMEYKQRYGYVSGGFIENLPSWEFITDNEDGNPPANNIDPDYIRSSPSEFDRFYKSLTGYSLGSYFHFIIKHVNQTTPLRMMDVTPEILQ